MDTEIIRWYNIITGDYSEADAHLFDPTNTNWVRLSSGKRNNSTQRNIDFTIIRSGSHNLYYKEIVQLEKAEKIKVCRINITSAAHIVNMTAQINVWNERWAWVHTFQQHMQTKKDLYRSYDANKELITVKDFEIDRDKLIYIANQIIWY
jgi:hypothetical protein